MPNTTVTTPEDTRKNSFSYADLLEQLQQYKPKTEDEIKAAAEAQIAGEYDLAKLNAQQKADQTIQSLQQQLAGIGTSYDRQLEENLKAYNRAYSQTDRHALSRGMQRSSYNAQVLANLLQEGNRAADDIQANRTAQESNINANIALTTQQLADQLAQLEAGKAKDLKAAEDAIRDQEYNRGQAQNELLLNLYQMAEQYGHTEPKNAGVGGGSAGSGGYSPAVPQYVQDILGYNPGSSTTTKKTGSSGSSSSSSKATTTAKTGSDTLDAFERDLFGVWNGLEYGPEVTQTQKYADYTPAVNNINKTTSDEEDFMTTWRKQVQEATKKALK